MIMSGNNIVTLWNVHEDISEPEENYEKKTCNLVFLPSIVDGRNRK